jgi:osmoprotectant transport system permease protein
MTWSWIPENAAEIWQLARENAFLGVVSALLGLVISLPLGIMAARWRWFHPPAVTTVNVLYAIPALALMVALIPALGLTNTNVIVALTLYSLCVLVPNIVAGLRGVPEPVRQAATAMGYGQSRRLVAVELPLAVPVIIGGLRVAMVSSISLATIGQLIGVSSLGYLFIDGEQRDFLTEVYVGLACVVVLALACDLVLVGIRRVLTPWVARS